MKVIMQVLGYAVAALFPVHTFTNRGFTREGGDAVLELELPLEEVTAVVEKAGLVLEVDPQAPALQWLKDDTGLGVGMVHPMPLGESEQAAPEPIVDMVAFRERKARKA